MATILNSAILDSAILFCTKLWLKTGSIWLKLIHSHSTWWWQPSWILPFWIQPFAQKKLHSCILTQIDDGSHLEFCYLGFSHFAQKKFTCSFWLNLMMAAILKSAMLILSFAQKNSLMILTQLDDGSHLEFCHFGFRHCHLGFRHLVIFSQIDSNTLPTWLKLIESDLTWWWQPSWILPSWIQPFCTKLWLKLVQSVSNLIHSHSTWWWQPSWILPCWIQSFCTKKNFTVLSDSTWWWHLEFMLDWDTAILDSITLLSSLRFTQKHSPSTLTLSQTNSIWLT